MSPVLNAVARLRAALDLLHAIRTGLVDARPATPGRPATLMQPTSNSRSARPRAEEPLSGLCGCRLRRIRNNSGSVPNPSGRGQTPECERDYEPDAGATMILSTFGAQLEELPMVMVLLPAFSWTVTSTVSYWSQL